MAWPETWCGGIGGFAVNLYFAYPALALAGIVMSSVVWTKVLRRDAAAHDYRLELIYIGALCGAFLGAKLVYFVSEGWYALSDPALTREQVWLNLLTGKTITGALLGGYLTVEVTKKWLGYDKATGDFFAVVAPFGLLFGRVGCFIQGCCPGVAMDHHWYTMADTHGIDRWPAVPVEFGFNLAMFVVALLLYRRHVLQGQLFHVYLMAYGLFRFAHEFVRDTPALAGPVSGYQLTALAIFALGLVRFRQRMSQSGAVTDRATAPQ